MKRPHLSILTAVAVFLLTALACGIPTAGNQAAVPTASTVDISAQAEAEENNGFSAGATATRETVDPTIVEEPVSIDPTAAESGETSTSAQTDTTTAAEQVAPVPEEMVALEDMLVSLYEQINPAVIHIFVYQENFPIGTGTGFVIDSEGHAVTNNHVVADGDRFEVSFPGGQRREAELVGTDIDSDLAVIRITNLPDNVTPLILGDSSQLHVGQFVVAIGNPFGQESSMSLGIVSGLGRSLRSQRILEGGGQYSLPQVIQTDAPINPGNSGGPLLNLKGEVVGVNAAIRTETGTNSGVGFSIPVNAVKRVAPALIADGAYIYPYLGVSIFDGIDLNIQEQLNLPQTNGAYVTTVLPGGPADEAGIIGSGGNNLTGGDFIISVDGQQVNEFGDLISYLVFETEVGQTILLTVIRDGETIEVPVVLGARP